MRPTVARSGLPLQPCARRLLAWGGKSLPGREQLTGGDLPQSPHGKPQSWRFLTIVDVCWVALGHTCAVMKHWLAGVCECVG
ncbi:hypothetical protein, partial [Vandammella animalimorsus]|uniref:hypothetical protein n=1 Tax=Vandammella animalimorsus TaxID=2029117 RepID=UPI001EED1584